MDVECPACGPRSQPYTGDPPMCVNCGCPVAAMEPDTEDEEEEHVTTRERRERLVGDGYKEV